MRHDVSLIATIATGFGLAMILGLLALRLKVPPLVETARALNPNVEILLRTLSEDEARLRRQEGLGTVFLGKEELSRSMSTQVPDRMRPHRGNVSVRS